MRSGDCQPIYGGTTVFLCRKSIPGHATGEFSVHVNGVLFEGTSLMIEAPPPPPVKQPSPIQEEDSIQPEIVGTVVDGRKIVGVTEDGLLIAEYVPPPPLPKQIGKTPLQKEVAAAEASGLMGNSPLVQAIRIANRANDRARELYSIYIDLAPFDVETYQRYNKDFEKAIEEETGWPASVFMLDLPNVYKTVTGIQLVNEYEGEFSRYWMIIEFLRFTFNPQERTTQLISHGFTNQ